MKKNLHLIEERFPHYTKQEQDFPNRFYHVFEKTTGEAHYQMMVDALKHAVEAKTYLPVLRLCHGEFILCVGRWMPKGFVRKIKFVIKSVLMEFGILPKIDYGGSASNGTSREKLPAKEFKRIREIWVDAARDISQHGFLAPAFNDRHSYVENIDKMCRFFQANGIRFGADNYFPFFGLYGYLAGPDFEALVKGRNVVAVTWLDEDRRKGLTATFQSMGAANINFLEVSPHAAVLEKIEPEKLEIEPDIAIFACGLGSAPMIQQFKGTHAVCIDAGFALDMLANQDLRGKRAWTLPDHLYDDYQKSKSEK
ncbi:MAG: hypothetical protein ACSHX4_01330 [Opitutaceae bacterium]